MASREVEPMDVASKSPAGPPGGSEEPDRKYFTATGAETGGTMDTDTLLRGHHAVPVSIKGAAILQKMETRELAGGEGGEGGEGGGEVLGSKAAPTPAALAAKVQSAAATTGVYVTQNAEEYAKVKAAEEVAATLGLYETQGERRQRQQEETADYVEIWPRKEDVAQLESMVETAPGGELEGVRLEKGGDIAKLHSAADKGSSCVVRAKVSELLVKATLERPKDAKDRADQRLAQVQAASEGAQGRMGEGMEVLSGSPPAVFFADKPGAARIETEEMERVTR